jgi:hypothetical protein
MQYREEARRPRLAPQLTAESYSSSSDSSSNGHRDTNGTSSPTASTAAAATAELSVIDKTGIASAQRQGIPTYACQLIWVCSIHFIHYFGKVKFMLTMLSNSKRAISCSLRGELLLACCTKLLRHEVCALYPSNLWRSRIVKGCCESRLRCEAADHSMLMLSFCCCMFCC